MNVSTGRDLEVSTLDHSVTCTTDGAGDCLHMHSMRREQQACHLVTITPRLVVLATATRGWLHDLTHAVDREPVRVWAR